MTDFRYRVHKDSEEDSLHTTADLRNQFIHNSNSLPDPFNHPETAYNPTPALYNTSLAQSTSLINPFQTDSHTYSQPTNPFLDGTHHTEYRETLPMSTPFANNDSMMDQDPDTPQPRRKKKRRRINFATMPYFTFFVTLVQVVVFIVELIRSSQLTGSAFQTQPYFNPMLGPSTYLLINMGARYVPCMVEVPNFTNYTDLLLPCPNSTSLDTDVCNLNQLCGLNGIKQVMDSATNESIYVPAQWYRIFIPIFLHAGFLHIIFNLFLQLTLAATIESHIGTSRYALVYVASGISGFLLGANFSPTGMASTGASGSLFGIMALNLLLFIYAGKSGKNLYNTKHFKTFLLVMIAEIVVSFVLGLLPGLDNFSHIGGFIMGILLGVLLLKDPNFVYDENVSPDIQLNNLQGLKEKFNVTEMMNRRVRSRFVLWCVVRAVCFGLIIAYFVGLAINFFRHGGGHCSWCKYINCIPVNGWCELGAVSVSSETSPTSSAVASLSSTQPTSATLSASVFVRTTVVTPTPTTTYAPIENTNTGSFPVETGFMLYGLMFWMTWRFLKRERHVKQE